eukprot:TRINITY_DN6193_c0_g1_i1.p1 TRINITY_DN6193_c0_g1~~TRINITY_DN6193_c0_g1_i1.p1  ORF type:complete len:611 (+),score=118.40 TRINITY_DN6193_c0_g1_i1:25-1833(+)
MSWLFFLLHVLLLDCLASGAEPTQNADGLQSTVGPLALVAQQVGVPLTPETLAALGHGEEEERDEVEQAEELQREGAFSLLALTVMLVVSILLTYAFLVLRCNLIPDSVVTIAFGMLVGLYLQLSGKEFHDWFTLRPEVFFLFLLPPIIFESGYNLHKGNFFSNFGSISLFAIVGTIISTAVIGLMSWLFGFLDFVDSLTFGALISAVDPVATLAIFEAIDVDPTVHTLVFGESVLNDAVSVVLTRTLHTFSTATGSSNGGIVMDAVLAFLLNLFGSIFVGTVIALTTALVFKCMRIRQFPSLELSLVMLLCYLPYLIADAVGFSGIMAVLFAGIVNSHYTFFNLSTFTQITTQQAYRMIAYICETLVFAYLGLAVFQFQHDFHAGFVCFSLVACVVGRALNIFPLSIIANKYRTTKICRSHQLIMWFSGLRGAIAFTLALALPSSGEHLAVHRKLVTTTLFIVIFTIVFMGGGTIPLLALLKTLDLDGHAPAPRKALPMSRTTEQGKPLKSSEAEPERVTPRGEGKLARFSFDTLDNRFLKPLFRGEAWKSALTAQEIGEELQQFTSRLQRPNFVRLSDPEDNSPVMEPPGTHSGGHPFGP